MERLMMTLKTSVLAARSSVTSSAPTRKSLLVILFTILTTVVDSLPQACPTAAAVMWPTAMCTAVSLPPMLLLLLGVKYKMPDEGDGTGHSVIVRRYITVT